MEEVNKLYLKFLNFSPNVKLKNIEIEKFKEPWNLIFDPFKKKEKLLGSKRTLTWHSRNFKAYLVTCLLYVYISFISLLKKNWRKILITILTINIILFHNIYETAIKIFENAIRKFKLFLFSYFSSLFPHLTVTR